MTVECDGALLAGVSIEHLEEAAFLFCNEVPEPPGWEAPTLCAALLLDEALELAITVTTDFAHELAATLLGVDADDPLVAEKTHDALGELLNMLAGVVTEEMAHGGHATQIGIPTVQECDADARTTRATRARCTVHLLADNEHRIDLTMG